MTTSTLKRTPALLELCATTHPITLTKGPPVDVPAAISHIKLTLDWFHQTQKTGGRGYSVAQTKKTNAYLALVALGGQWNG